MFITEVSLLGWVLTVVELMGVISALAVRVSEGSLHQQCCQRLFLCFLLLVGGITMLSAMLGLSHCPAAAITFCVMVLTAVWDFRPAGQAAAW